MPREAGGEARGEAVVRTDGLLLWRGRVLRAALGRGGIRLHKEEGDGATPAGLLPLRRVLYRADRVPSPRCAVPVEPIAPDDGWCDDPAHRDYNRLVRLPPKGAFEGRHEQLWRRDPLYDLIGVLGWNDAPVVKGRGSAIFLHVAAPGHAPTEGCVTLEVQDLAWLLAEGLTALRVLVD